MLFVYIAEVTLTRFPVLAEIEFYDIVGQVCRECRRQLKRQEVSIRKRLQKSNIDISKISADVKSQALNNEDLDFMPKRTVDVCVETPLNIVIDRKSPLQYVQESAGQKQYLQESRSSMLSWLSPVENVKEDPAD